MFFRKKSRVAEEVEVFTKKEFSSLGFDDTLYYIKREIGADLFAKKSTIENRLKLFCEQRDIYSFKELCESLKCKPDLRQELINLLTVNETYFYREQKQLQEAIDFAKSRSGRVDILCAPCASGEEVYTFSMMMSEKPEFLKSFSIKGVDINSEAIKKAEEGLYSHRSLHKLSSELKERYFLAKDDMYIVKRYLFPSVSFFKVNIFEESFSSIGKFDIIFSRNMLIYFDDDFRLDAVKRFSQLLKSDGRIYLGHADIVKKNRWITRYNSGSGCYIRNLA